MFKAIGEIWVTIYAVCAGLKRFFVQWFMPLHSDENDNEETSEDKDDDDKP